jgi:hypothetical protein
MNHVIIDINKEARKMGMSELEFKESCEEMIKLGFMKAVKDKYGDVYLQLSTPDDYINKHLDEMCNPLKLV